MPWRWHWKQAANQRSPTPTRAASSSLLTLWPGCRPKRSRSAGQPESAAPTTSWLRGCGARSRRGGVSACLQQWLGGRDQPGPHPVEVLPCKATQLPGRTPHEDYTKNRTLFFPPGVNDARNRNCLIKGTRLSPLVKEVVAMERRHPSWQRAEQLLLLNCRDRYGPPLYVSVLAGKPTRTALEYQESILQNTHSFVARRCA